MSDTENDSPDVFQLCSPILCLPMKIKKRRKKLRLKVVAVSDVLLNKMHSNTLMHTLIHFRIRGRGINRIEIREDPSKKLNDF